MQIRRGLYVVWRGQEYAANAEDANHFTLHRFDAGGPLMGKVTLPKTIRKSEVEAAYLVTWRARYKGHDFQVDACRDGKLVLSACLKPPGDLNFDEIDRSVWEKRVPVNEVDHVWEEKKPFV